MASRRSEHFTSNTMEQLTNLENSVMEMLLAGGDDVLGGLRCQLAASTCAGRENTGVGFYTTFNVPNVVPRVAGGKSFKFGDVSATVPGLQHGAGFLLFVKDGILEMLEGYTYDEPWPSQISTFEVSYVNGARDLESLRATWS